MCDAGSRRSASLSQRLPAWMRTAAARIARARAGRGPRLRGMSENHRDKRPVLVTGATGYVGGRLAEALVRSGRTVRCMARRPEFARELSSAECSVVAGDVSDPASLVARYVTRPPIATQRLVLAPDGRVIYGLKRHWRDGTSAVSFDPLTFIERLAALVPPPRAHQLTYHGVLAPASAWRDLVVPKRAPASTSPSCGPLAPNSPTAPSSSARSRSSRSSRSTWAELLRRVFAVDALTCPHCGGPRRLIAQLTDPIVVRKILAHLGLPTEPPRPAPARPREQFDFA